MPIVNAKADEVLKAFLREKVNGRSLKLRSNPADRLVGSFIWNRAVALTGTGAQDQGMTSAAAHDRVAIELPQVFQFVQDGNIDCFVDFGKQPPFTFTTEAYALAFTSTLKRFTTAADDAASALTADKLAAQLADVRATLQIVPLHELAA